MLEHTQTKRNQSIICAQRFSIIKSDSYTLPRVGNLVHFRVEHKIVFIKEIVGLFLYELLETTIVDGKPVILREPARINIKSKFAALNQR